MRSGPVRIEGIAGEVVVDSRMVGRPAVAVDGVPVPRLHGAWFLLPTDDGEGVPVLVRGGAGMSPHPRLVVGDEVYATGPAPPWWLQVLAVLPILAPFLGGGPGTFVAVAGIVTTWWVLRRPWSLRAHVVGVLAASAGSMLLAWAVGRLVAG